MEFFLTIVVTKLLLILTVEKVGKHHQLTSDLLAYMKFTKKVSTSGLDIYFLIGFYIIRDLCCRLDLKVLYLAKKLHFQL